MPNSSRFLHDIFNAVYNNDTHQLQQLLTQRAQLLKAGADVPSLNALYRDESLEHLGYTDYSLLSIAAVMGNRAVLELLLSKNEALLLNEINFKEVDKNGKTIVDIVLEQDVATQLVFIEAAIKQKSPVVENYLKKANSNCAIVFKAAINLILNESFDIKLTDAKYYIEIIVKTIERFPQRRKLIDEKILELSSQEKAMVSVLIAKFSFSHIKEFSELLNIKYNLKLVFAEWEKFDHLKSKSSFKGLLAVLNLKPRSGSASEADTTFKKYGSLLKSRANSVAEATIASSGSKLDIKAENTDEAVAVWYGNPAGINFTGVHANFVQAAIPLTALPPAQLPPSAAAPVLAQS